MNYLLRKYRLLKLHCRAYMLAAEADHVAELIEESQERHKRLVYELARVRRQIIAREAPEVLLRRTA